MGKIHDTITSIQNMETEQLMIVLSKLEDVAFSLSGVGSSSSDESLE